LKGQFVELPESVVGGARLSYIFNQIFAKTIMQCDALADLTNFEICAAMRNSAGPESRLFLPEAAFDLLIKRQIQKLEAPALKCVDLALQELLLLASQCYASKLSRFNNLHESLKEKAREIIRTCVPSTTRMVSSLIQIELAYINVEHPDFIGGSQALANVQPFMQTQSQSHLKPFVPNLQMHDELTGSMGGSPHRQMSSRYTHPARRDTIRLPHVPLMVATPVGLSAKENRDVEVLKNMIRSYFDIVKWKILDAVPKAIMHFLVHASCDAILEGCVAELYQPTKFDFLLLEADETHQRRLQCQQKLVELRRVQGILAYLPIMQDELQLMS